MIFLEKQFQHIRSRLKPTYLGTVKNMPGKNTLFFQFCISSINQLRFSRSDVGVSSISPTNDRHDKCKERLMSVSIETRFFSAIHKKECA